MAIAVAAALVEIRASLMDGMESFDVGDVEG
jgi:hypothetical protein